MGYCTLSAYSVRLRELPQTTAKNLLAARFFRQHCWAGWQSALLAAANATEHSIDGMDHTRLTYKFQGRYFRPMDVHGTVVKAALTLKRAFDV